MAVLKAAQGAKIRPLILFPSSRGNRNSVSGVLFPRWSDSGCRAVPWWLCWQGWGWLRWEAPCWRAAGRCRGWSGFPLSLLSLLKFGQITGNESPGHLSWCSLVGLRGAVRLGCCCKFPHPAAGVSALVLTWGVVASQLSLHGHSLQGSLL